MPVFYLTKGEQVHSDLTDDEADELLGIAARDDLFPENKYARQLHGKRPWTEAQRAWAHKVALDKIDAQGDGEAPYSGLIDYLRQRKSQKQTALLIVEAVGGDVFFRLNVRGQYAGTIFVSDSDDFETKKTYGHVNPDGKFYRRGNHLPGHVLGVLDIIRGSTDIEAALGMR